MWQYASRGQPRNAMVSAICAWVCNTRGAGPSVFFMPLASQFIAALARMSSSHLSWWLALLSVDYCLRNPCWFPQMLNDCHFLWKTLFPVNWLFLKPLWILSSAKFSHLWKRKATCSDSCPSSSRNNKYSTGQSNASYRASDKFCTLAYLGWNNLNRLY